jgi:phasin
MTTAKKAAKPALTQPAPAVETKVAAISAPAKAPAPVAMKPLVEFQEKLRLGAEQSVEQMRTQYAAIKGNAETATDKLEESVAAVHAGTRALNGKVFDLFRSQTNAGFAHLQALFATKNVAEAVKLQQDFVKTQMEALQAQSKEFTELATKLANDCAEPIKGAIVVPFKR